MQVDLGCHRLEHAGNEGAHLGEAADGVAGGVAAKAKGSVCLSPGRLPSAKAGHHISCFQAHGS